MEIYIRKFEKNDVTEMVKIWDEVVEDGIAFPQEELLDEKSGEEFFPPRHTVPWHITEKTVNY